MTRRLWPTTALLCVSVTMTACGGGGPRSAELSASRAWSRPTPANATNGVLYLTVTSDVADALAAVEVPARVARQVELHATMSAGQGAAHSHGAGTDGGESPAMRMEPVDSLAIDADGTLVLEPGGSHAMLLDLPRPLVRGDHFPAILSFTSGRTLEVDVVVADNPPT